MNATSTAARAAWARRRAAASDGWRQFRGNKAGLTGLIVLIIVVALALLLSPITAHAEEADEPAGQATASFSSTEEDSPAQAFVTAITLTAGSTAIAAVTATLGMAGFRKWAMIARCSSGSSSIRRSWAMARAIRAMVRRASPLPALSCSAMMP